MEDELNLVREGALRNAMLAKEAEQRKNDLIVYLAHDLKTPFDECYRLSDIIAGAANPSCRTMLNLSNT